MMGLNDSEKMAMGYQLNETVKSCFFDGKPCDIEKYTPHLTVSVSEVGHFYHYFCT